MRPNSDKKRPALMTLAALTLLASCAQPPVVSDHFYRFENPVPTQSFRQAPILGMVVVENPKADSLLGQRAILYSDVQRPHEVKQYSYHYWTKTPPRLIQEQLAEYLTATNAAESIAHAEQRDLAGCRLTGVIRRFERVIAGDQSSAVVELELRLTRINDRRGLWAGTYRATAPVATDDIHAVVEAFNAAMGELFGAMLTDLGAAPRDCPAPLR